MLLEQNIEVIYPKKIELVGQSASIFPGGPHAILRYAAETSTLFEEEASTFPTNRQGGLF